MAKNPKRVFGGIKSAFTEKINEANDYMKEEREYSEEDEQEIKSMILRLDAQIDRSETQFQEDLMDAFDEDYSTTAEAEFKNHVTNAKKSIKELRNYLKNLKEKVSGGSRTTQSAENGTNPASMKIDYSFRPEKLQMSYTLEEFHDWCDKFKAYFDHNKKVLERSEIAISRHLLHAVLDAKLINALKTEENVTNETPIVQGGQVKIIHLVFIEILSQF